MINIKEQIDNILELGEKKLKDSSSDEILSLISNDLLELAKKIEITNSCDYYKMLKLSLIYKNERYCTEIKSLPNNQIENFDFMLTYDRLSSKFVFFPLIEEVEEKDVENFLFGFSVPTENPNRNRI